MHDQRPPKDDCRPRPGWPLQRILAIWFAALVLISCVAVGGLTYYLRSRDLHKLVTTQLTAHRDDKIRDIEQWFEYRRNDVDIWSSGLLAVQSAELYAAGEPISDRETKVQQLEKMRHTYQAHSISIVEPNTGETIISTEPPGSVPHGLPADLRARAVAQNGPIHTDVFLCPLHDEPVMIIASAVRSPQHAAPIGILTFYMDLGRYFYPEVLKLEGLGESGEVVLVNRNATPQKPLRHLESAVARGTLDTEMATRAATGKTGELTAPDYRGETVMAAYGYLPLLDWGVVVQQDEREITEPIRQMAYQVFLVSVGALLLASALSFLVARTIATPAAGIAGVSEQITKGDLSVRAMPNGPLELRTVARNFNRMIEQLARQLWTGEHLSSIFSAASAHNRLNSMLEEVLPQIMETTRSQVSAFYLSQNGTGVFRRITVNGMPAESAASHIHTSPPDHLLAQAAAKGEVQVFSGFSDQNDLQIVTQTGITRPAALMSIPFIHLGKPIAIMGLASLHEYRPEEIEIARTLSLGMGQSIAAALANEENLRISEELRVNNEELTSANEELQSQTEELQQQSEELHQQTEELHQQTQELAHQRAQVEEADRLKSQFLSNMSHELRTPLNSIMALSQLMLARGTGASPDKEAEYLSIIERNGRHLLNLINDILDLSKIESGRMDVTPTRFRPEIVVQRALEVARPLAEAKGLSITVEAQPVPEITTDRDKVHQILLNLLSNAVKFTDRGGITVRISADGEKILFAIQDTGIGISDADLSQIFDEFRQVDGSTTRRHEGTGLGLSIGQKLARLLGGEITVDTKPGKGSTFVLTLPIKASTARTGTVSPTRIPRTRPSRRARNILVVDDDPSVRNLLRTYLTESGYNVLVASNGSEALDLASTHDLHAMTLDVIMPDMDGWEVIRELKSAPKTASIPILVISVTEDRATALALGASGFLLKPVDKHVLLSELQRISRSRPVHHILVVDDDAPTRKQLKMMLEDRYERVSTATGGEEALRMVRESPPDAIVLDLMMPDVDGFTVLERLRRDPATYNIPVLILTAKDLTAAEQKRLRHAVSQIVTKGTMDRDRLLRELDETLAELDQPPPHAARRPSLVLVVDDDEIAAIQISSAMEDAGYRPVVASSGAQALAHAREEVPDAVVLDLMMPGMDGFEVLRQLRSATATAEVPVLILTAKELTAKEQERLADDRVRQLIQKGSVDRDQLVQVVRELLNEPAETQAAAANTDTDTDTASDGQGVILVVEDNSDNLVTIAAVLDDLGRKHAHAADGEQALRMVREIRPALVLMDMQLPVLSGMDAVRQIKADPRLATIPVVALTAKAMHGDRERVLAAGCDDYMAKPLDRFELARILKKWTGDGSNR
jgi:CheY-like chemotaxis protein/signal transduction histidine kinase